ncbi:uncharacterized protein LOC110913275 [Helianthus annuus]|uniref:uncharacterized protein LOC110913275 n=1 Tax=Helianthus annuus TaxID=4232 RepID=UPI000B8FDE7E|nr:uncharacterized protein LOC110913275 [Helianthus annuus]
MPAMMLEAVTSQDLWIWHAFFGMPGSHNDINFIHHSPLFNDLINGVGPKGTFIVSDVEYKYRYYLVDGIYPYWAVFVKSFLREGTIDPKRRKFNKVQMMARKEIDRAFGVLQKMWHILSMPCRLYEKDRIRNVMYACIILHNMILGDEGRAIVEYYGKETASNIEDISNEEISQNQNLIESRQISSNLQANLLDVKDSM